MALVLVTLYSNTDVLMRHPAKCWLTATQLSTMESFRERVLAELEGQGENAHSTLRGYFSLFNKKSRCWFFSAPNCLMIRTIQDLWVMVDSTQRYTTESLPASRRTSTTGHGTQNLHESNPTPVIDIVISTDETVLARIPSVAHVGPLAEVLVPVPGQQAAADNGAAHLANLISPLTALSLSKRQFTEVTNPRVHPSSTAAALVLDTLRQAKQCEELLNMLQDRKQKALKAASIHAEVKRLQVKAPPIHAEEATTAAAPMPSLVRLPSRADEKVPLKQEQVPSVVTVGQNLRRPEYTTGDGAVKGEPQLVVDGFLKNIGVASDPNANGNRDCDNQPAQPASSPFRAMAEAMLQRRGLAAGTQHDLVVTPQGSPMRADTSEDNSSHQPQRQQEQESFRARQRRAPPPPPPPSASTADADTQTMAVQDARQARTLRAPSEDIAPTLRSVNDGMEGSPNAKGARGTGKPLLPPTATTIDSHEVDDLIRAATSLSFEAVRTLTEVQPGGGHPNMFMSPPFPPNDDRFENNNVRLEPPPRTSRGLQGRALPPPPSMYDVEEGPVTMDQTMMFSPSVVSQPASKMSTAPPSPSETARQNSQSVNRAETQAIGAYAGRPTIGSSSTASVHQPSSHTQPSYLDASILLPPANRSRTIDPPRMDTSDVIGEAGGRGLSTADPSELVFGRVSQPEVLVASTYPAPPMGRLGVLQRSPPTSRAPSAPPGSAVKRNRSVSPPAAVSADGDSAVLPLFTEGHNGERIPLMWSSMGTGAVEVVATKDALAANTKSVDQFQHALVFALPPVTTLKNASGPSKTTNLSQPKLAAASTSVSSDANKDPLAATLLPPLTSSTSDAIKAPTSLELLGALLPPSSRRKLTVNSVGLNKPPPAPTTLPSRMSRVTTPPRSRSSHNPELHAPNTNNGTMPPPPTAAPSRRSTISTPPRARSNSGGQQIAVVTTVASAASPPTPAPPRSLPTRLSHINTPPRSRSASRGPTSVLRNNSTDFGVAGITTGEEVVKNLIFSDQKVPIGNVTTVKQRSPSASVTENTAALTAPKGTAHVMPTPVNHAAVVGPPTAMGTPSSRTPAPSPPPIDEHRANTNTAPINNNTKAIGVAAATEGATSASRLGAINNSSLAPSISSGGLVTLLPPSIAISALADRFKAMWDQLASEVPTKGIVKGKGSRIGHTTANVQLAFMLPPYTAAVRALHECLLLTSTTDNIGIITNETQRANQWANELHRQLAVDTDNINMWAYSPSTPQHTKTGQASVKTAGGTNNKTVPNVRQYREIIAHHAAFSSYYHQLLGTTAVAAPIDVLGRRRPNLLISGPTGTGRTTALAVVCYDLVARAVALKAYHEHLESTTSPTVSPTLSPMHSRSGSPAMNNGASTPRLLGSSKRSVSGGQMAMSPATPQQRGPSVEQVSNVRVADGQWPFLSSTAQGASPTVPGDGLASNAPVLLILKMEDILRQGHVYSADIDNAATQVALLNSLSRCVLSQMKNEDHSEIAEVAALLSSVWSQLTAISTDSDVLPARLMQLFKALDQTNPIDASYLSSWENVVTSLLATRSTTGSFDVIFADVLPLLLSLRLALAGETGKRLGDKASAEAYAQTTPREQCALIIDDLDLLYRFGGTEDLARCLTNLMRLRDNEDNVANKNDKQFFGKIEVIFTVATWCTRREGFRVPVSGESVDWTGPQWMAVPPMFGGVDSALDSPELAKPMSSWGDEGNGSGLNLPNSHQYIFQTNNGEAEVVPPKTAKISQSNSRNQSRWSEAASETNTTAAATATRPDNAGHSSLMSKCRANTSTFALMPLEGLVPPSYVKEVSLRMPTLIRCEDPSSPVVTQAHSSTATIVAGNELNYSDNCTVGESFSLQQLHGYPALTAQYSDLVKKLIPQHIPRGGGDGDDEENLNTTTSPFCLVARVMHADKEGEEDFIRVRHGGVRDMLLDLLEAAALR